MDEIEKGLLLIKIKCCLAEKERLSQWALSSDVHTQALVDGLSACKTHFKEITEHRLFHFLSESVQQNVVLNSQSMSRLCSVASQYGSIPNNNTPIMYQIPCHEDLLAMQGLSAGGDDSQKERLAKMSTSLRGWLDASQLAETREPIVGCWVDRLPWLMVFQAIRKHDLKLAEAAFNAIPADDLLLKALLKAHSKPYLLSLVLECTQLTGKQTKEIDQDVICGHLTFEVLIHDLMTTLEQQNAINYCFGLPTHHAYRDRAAGFCLLNKVAIIMAYEQLTLTEPFTAVILGTDVNRDDGLSAILMAKDDEQSLTHLDISDSRVYPWHDVDFISQQLQLEAHEQVGMMLWQKGEKRYFNIDLAQKGNWRKKDDQYHPALIMALRELEHVLANAALSQEKIILFLPTGWDSHYQEEAACGRWINQKRMLTPKQSLQCRFTDEDLSYLNQQIVTLYERYQSTIVRIYWQLEGGYTDQVNARQIKNLTTIVQQSSLYSFLDPEACCL